MRKPIQTILVGDVGGTKNRLGLAQRNYVEKYPGAGIAKTGRGTLRRCRLVYG